MPKTLHVAVLRPNFGDPITRPVQETGFFVAQHHWWCAERRGENQEGFLAAKKKAQGAFGGCEELESL